MNVMCGRWDGQRPVYRAVTLESEADKVIGMVCINREDANLLVVSEKGYGKRSLIDDYRITETGWKRSKDHKYHGKNWQACCHQGSGR